MTSIRSSCISRRAAWLPRATTRRRVLVLLLSVAWCCAIGAGLHAMMRLESTPGEKAATPAFWPAASKLPVALGTPALVVFIHPFCPCTDATLNAIAVLAAPPSPRPFQLVIAASNWQSDKSRVGNVSRATSIPGATIFMDGDGREAARFGALTSGHAVFYDEHGALRFSGGLTPGRGMSGPSAGQEALMGLLAATDPPAPLAAEAPVFGCSLLGDQASSAPACCRERQAR